MVMRQRLLPVLAIAVASATPLSAQVTDDDEGRSLMEEGARLFMRGLMDEFEPALRELEGIADEIEPAFREMVRQMGPAFAEIISTIDNLRYYEAPVLLDNGDILIRRRDDAPPYEPPEEAPINELEDDIEL